MIKELTINGEKFKVTKETTEDNAEVIVARNGDVEHRFSPSMTNEELKLMAENIDTGVSHSDLEQVNG